MVILCFAELISWARGVMWAMVFTAALAHGKAEESFRSASQSGAHSNASTTAVLMQELLKQGTQSADIMGVDTHGIPLVCGNAVAGPQQRTNSQLDSLAALPPGRRSWETIPAVVRNDGVDTFRLEVNCNGPVSNVVDNLSFWVLSESGESRVRLRDDGLNGDRAAGDYVFTSERLKVNTEVLGPDFFYQRDTNSPAGLFYVDAGLIEIVELSGESSQFLVQPEVGVLDHRIAERATRALSPDVQAAPHLINVRTTGNKIQGTLRGGEFRLPELTTTIYSVLPDAFDFFIGFSTEHVELLPRLASQNFVMGVHVSVRVPFSGTGRVPFDNSAAFGSAGRLQAVNLLDVHSRGLHAVNATHELMHHWAAYLDMGLGLNQDGAHYDPRSNVGSLVGGQLWDRDESGSFVMNCEQGRNGAHHAPPLDKYMMGLIGAADVPTLHRYSLSNPPPFAICGQTVTNINVSVTMADIQQAHNLRIPGQQDAQRDFTIGFVVESRDRLLTPTEMTFYEILGGWYTKPVPAHEPDPYVTQNWVPIQRFFGEGTTWSSHIAALVEAHIAALEFLLDGAIRISGSGFPGQVYTLESSSDLRDWSTVGTTTASNSRGAVLIEANLKQKIPRQLKE